MAHLSVRRGVVVPRTASWTPSSVWTAPAFCRPPSISASSKRADLVQRQPSQTPRSEIAHTPAALVHSGALERGGSTRVEHAVWGFKSGRSISRTIQPLVKDSSRCPEGDLPTWDTHLRHVASALACVPPGL